MNAMIQANSRPLAAQAGVEEQKFDTISPKFHFSRPSLLMNSSTYDDFQAKGKNYV
jgi:hypothetical protein